VSLSENQYNNLAKIKEKSEDDYEKNIVYISAGTLVLSLTFIEKIVNLKDSSVIWVLISSWCFLAVTLLFNLVSHQLSSFYHDRCMALYSVEDITADEETDNAIR
jgi:hypothetical protein